MPEASAHISEHARVVDTLRAAAASGTATQTYLFAGSVGAGKLQAAYDFAQAILCEHGGCGTCDGCERISRRTHPDVYYYEPEGDKYLFDQARELIADVFRSPIRAARKVYILDKAECFNEKAANALLKTFEEPPAKVTFILLTTAPDAVLSTITSRCQVIRFQQVSAAQAVEVLAQRSGTSADLAAAVLQACNGSSAAAEAFLTSPESLKLRSDVLTALGGLSHANNWSVIASSAKLNSYIEVLRAKTSEALDEEREELVDFLSKGAMSQLADRNKRLVRSSEHKAMLSIMGIVRTWLRDVLLVCADSPHLMLNTDVRSSIDAAAAKTNEARVAAALSAVNKAESALTYNVSSQTYLDALLLEIRSVLYGMGFTH